MNRTTIAIVGTLALCACSSPSTEVTYHRGQLAQANDFPFSEAVRVGDTLYLSGQIGNFPGTTDLPDGGIGPETAQTLENIREILERYGSSLDDVVKCTVFLVDIDEWPAMNNVYTTYFPNEKPARSAMAGSGLALGARVEIECIAVIPE
ncbi:MAG: RidA family protein [Planctomycetota bacterium]|jgi:reactive intermediate/imine deaminase